MSELAESEEIKQYVEYARKQGCPDEVADKIPEMLEAMKNYTLFGIGPTPEKVNPGFFLDNPAKVLPLRKNNESTSKRFIKGNG